MHQTELSRKFQSAGSRPAFRRRWRAALVLIVLLLPGLLGAWRGMSGDTIDPRHVGRIQDGKTSKNEIMLLFGDPQEIDRTQEGLIYHYKSFKDAPAMPFRPENRKINPQSDSLYVINEDKTIKKAPLKTEGKILKSTLTIRFKPDGQTVMSHEYKEY
jgi:hypothetical protein